MTRKSIPEDVADILQEANPEGIKDPSLVIIALVDDSKDSEHVLNNIVRWISKHNISTIRMVIVDSIDDKSIWLKLRIYDIKRGPKVLIFNNSMSLVDIYSGVISVEFLDTFTLPLIM